MKPKLPRGIQRRGSALYATFTWRGELQRRSLGEVTVSRAKEMRAEFVTQVIKGTYVPAKEQRQLDLVAAATVEVEQAGLVSLNAYFADNYRPWAKDNKKPSTVAAYQAYWSRYFEARTDVPLSSVTITTVATWLQEIADSFEVNSDTLGKCRSILSAIFTHAISRGAYPAKSAAENPAHGALIPSSDKAKRDTVAATAEQVRAILSALKGMPLERAAVAICAMLGLGPSEARGLRWSDWDRAKQQVHVQRNYWHGFEGTPKTPKRNRFVAVARELREILLALWKHQGSPVDSWVLAAPEDSRHPVVLDNLAKRSIRKRLAEVNAQSEKHVIWLSWYCYRRFHGTAVRAESGSSDTASKALGNSKEIADRHYIKPADVLPDVRKAVTAAVAGLTA